MKSYLPLLTFAVLLTSCSSVYKSGQTPDDVYFSPERQREEYVRVEEGNERMYRNDETDREDRYLRMKARNRRYGLLDDTYDSYYYNGADYNRFRNYYSMNTYAYNRNYWMYNNHYGGVYSYDPFYYNPYYGNPYYTGIVYGNLNPKYNKPRTTNLHMFDANGNSSNPNMPRNNGRTFRNGSDRNDNYRGNGTNAGGFMRDVFGAGNNTNNSSNAGKSSSSNNESSGSSSSGSSSSGSSRAPVRKF